MPKGNKSYRTGAKRKPRKTGAVTKRNKMTPKFGKKGAKKKVGTKLKKIKKKFAKRSL
jgi:hypothetical protein